MHNVATQTSSAMQGNGAGPGMAYLHGSLLLDGRPHQGCPVRPMPGSFPAQLSSTCPAAVCLVQYLGDSLSSSSRLCMPHALNYLPGPFMI